MEVSLRYSTDSTGYSTLTRPVTFQMHPRAVRIMEHRYFEQRAMLGGMAPGMGMFDGYRKGEKACRLRVYRGMVRA
jgi:hypothetical protein